MGAVQRAGQLTIKERMGHAWQRVRVLMELGAYDLARIAQREAVALHAQQTAADVAQLEREKGLRA